MRFALAVVLVCGCDKLLGLDPVVQPPPPPDARPDAPPCANGPLADSFDVAPPCSGLGFADADPTTSVTIAGGRLVVAPGAKVSSTRGGCISGGVTMPFTSQIGAFMQVTSPPGPGEYMYWSLDWQGTTDASTIGWGGDVVYAHGGPNNGVVLGHVTFDPVTTSWVRVRPSDDGTAVIAEVSADGFAWTLFAWDPVSPPASVAPYFYGGTFAQEVQPVPIYFDGFDVCPTP